MITGARGVRVVRGSWIIVMAGLGLASAASAQVVAPPVSVTPPPVLPPLVAAPTPMLSPLPPAAAAPLPSAPSVRVSPIPPPPPMAAGVKPVPVCVSKDTGAPTTTCDDRPPTVVVRHDPR